MLPDLERLIQLQRLETAISDAREAIEALPVLEQRLIRLRLRDGRSWREIAARTGHSQRTLRRALDDAMRHLANAVA